MSAMRPHPRLCPGGTKALGVCRVRLPSLAHLGDRASQAPTSDGECRSRTASGCGRDAVEKRGTISGRIRMAVLADFKATTINDFLTQNFATGSTIFTDGLKTFTGLDEIFQHVPRTQPLRTELHQGAKSVVPLADRAIGNLQQWLLGTHHGVSRAQLQVYLDEFVFRHNRRRQPMAGFQTLLGLGTVHRSTPYNDIRRAKDLSRPRIQG